MICGQYVGTFTEGNMGMLEGASTNAPYEFHWLYVKAIENGEIVCQTQCRGGREIRLPIMQTKRGERSEVEVRDPLFGPQRFVVAPFLSDHAPPLAQVDRNPEGHDPEEGHGAEHESPVAAGDAPDLGSYSSIPLERGGEND